MESFTVRLRLRRHSDVHDFVEDLKLNSCISELKNTGLEVEFTFTPQKEGDTKELMDDLLNDTRISEDFYTSLTESSE